MVSKYNLTQDNSPNIVKSLVRDKSSHATYVTKGKSHTSARQSREKEKKKLSKSNKPYLKFGKK